MTAKRKGLRKHHHARLAAEAAKLNPKEERKLAGEDLGVSDEEKLKVAKVIIGERIRRRLSQTALARWLGVTQQQISKLENGETLHREAHVHSARN